MLFHPATATGQLEPGPLDSAGAPAAQAFFGTPGRSPLRQEAADVNQRCSTNQREGPRRTSKDS
jgi:hypothetical protein